MKYKRLKDESDDQLILRICNNKSEIGTWEDVANILNNILGTHYTESAFRKKKQYYDKLHNANKKNESKEINNINSKIRELERMKIQYRDERNAWSKQNYAASRIDETMEILKKSLTKQGKINFEINEVPVIKSDNDLIVCLSDLHIGASFDSFCGKYNSSIAKERLNNYLNEIVKIQQTHNSEKCIISLQGDIISGSIHKTLQVTNKENVIEQIKIAVELLSSFCYELTKFFTHVHLYNVVGNHGRLVENKEDALYRENFDDLIGWTISKTLEHIKNFHYMKHRNIDVDIADLIVRDNYYLSVHGDKDKFDKQGVLSLCSTLGYFPKAILFGHMHNAAYQEVNGVQMIRSGSLCGSGDDYTITNRLVGDPTQAVLVCDKKGIRCIYNVNVK